MRRMKMSEARRLFSAIVKDAERGRSTIVTRRGREVARIGPVAPGRGGRLPDLTDFRASIKVEGKPVSQAVIDQRKEARY